MPERGRCCRDRRAVAAVVVLATVVTLTAAALLAVPGAAATTGDGPVVATDADRADAPSNGTGVVGATPTRADAAGPVTGEVVARRTGNTTVEYEIALTVEPDRVDELRFETVALPGLSVETGEGFEDGAGRALWDGETAAPTATVVVDYAALPDDVPAGVVHEDWLLGMVFSAEVTWIDDEGAGSVSFDEIRGREGWTARAENGAIAPELFVYFGEYEVVEVTADGERILVIVGEAADLRETDLDLMRRTAAAHPVNLDPGTPTIGVAVPRTATEGYDGVLVNSLVRRGFAGRASTGPGEAFLVVDSGGPRVWLEEYLHTQQSYTTTERTAWLNDAVVGYYKRYYQHRVGDRQFEWFINKMTNPLASSDATLSRPDSWDSVRPRYQKGPKVVAYLDWRIRELTDGERSFYDVERRLNERDDPVTLFALKRTVADVVGSDELDDEIDRYVTTGEFPSAEAYPASYAPGEGNGSRYVETPTESVVGTTNETATDDADGNETATDDPDGNETDPESSPTPGFGAAALVAVLAGLAVLAWRTRR